METIRRFIGSNATEDMMDVDIDFTERYLSHFATIDRQTIEVLIDNGYQSKDQLLAFDIKEDLPLLPELNMAQKSLLRKVLQHFHESHQLEAKVQDVTADSIEALPPTPPVNKRKLESTPQSSSPKRTRTSMARSSFMRPSMTPDDGLGPRMREMAVKARRSIRSVATTSGESDSDLPDIETSYRTTRRSNGFTAKQTIKTEAEEDEEEDETNRSFVISPRPSNAGSRQSNASQRFRPLFATKSIRSGFRPELLNESFGSTRSTRQSVGSSKAPTTKKTPAKTSSPAVHIPTPTELEVRERLEKKKALAAQKGGRKRASRV